MVVEIVGIGFFGYLIGNMNSILVKIDSISEMKETHEDDVNIWMIRLDKAFKERILNHYYFKHTVTFFQDLWDKEYETVITSEFYLDLKPCIQNHICDLIYKNFYEQFEVFFENTEP